MARVCKISQAPGLTLFLLTMSTGSPLQSLGKSDSVLCSHTPDVELQLENLKVRNVSLGDMHDASSPLENLKPAPAVKSDLNLEKPTVSDNSSPDTFWDAMNDIAEKRNDFQSPFQALDTSYDPHDIAEYIFWTGDEKGVAIALGEMLDNEGISKEEAIVFLELVKAELQQLKARYDHHEPDETRLKNQQIHSASYLPLQKSKVTDSQSPNSSAVKLAESGISTGNGKSSNNGKAYATIANEKASEIWRDYEENIPKVEQLETRKNAALQNEIQQLARELFSKGPTENPQLALQRLARFVEKLAKL